jgi:hypothetical protein
MSNVTKTTFLIVTSNSEYTIPGDWTPKMIQDSYASQIQGITNLVAEEEILDNGDGTSTRSISFKPKTGNKG